MEDELPPPKCRCTLAPHFCIKHGCWAGKPHGQKCLRIMRNIKYTNYVVYLGGTAPVQDFTDFTEEELDRAIFLLDNPGRSQVFQCEYAGDVDDACKKNCWAFEMRGRHCPRRQRY